MQKVSCKLVASEHEQRQEKTIEDWGKQENQTHQPSFPRI